MKPIHFLPPVIALAVVSTWIARGRGSIATLEEQSAGLRQRLAARSSGHDASVAKRRAPPSDPNTAQEPIDWKELAAQMAKMRHSDDIKAMRWGIRILQRIQAMTRDEIVAALDEIAALDLPEDSRDGLEQLLLGPLAKKDPESMLNRFSDRLSDGDGLMRWHLSNAMKEWLAKDPAAATAWFDQRIADGSFDSKALDGSNSQRLEFEGQLISFLISTDTAAAALRLQALPEGQPAEVLMRRAGIQVKEEDQLAWANLVRKELPEHRQASLIATQAAMTASRKDFTEVDAYLARVEATSAERAEAVNQVLRNKVAQAARNEKITHEKLDELRAWATSQSPDSVDQATGRAIAQASFSSNEKFPFAEAAALATEYHSSSGNDDVLVAFLENNWHARQNKDQALELAEKISDPARRAEVIKTLK